MRGGIALIVEGVTEKVFYSELIRSRALVHGATVERASDGEEPELFGNEARWVVGTGEDQ